MDTFEVGDMVEWVNPNEWNRPSFDYFRENSVVTAVNHNRVGVIINNGYHVWPIKYLRLVRKAMTTESILEDYTID